MTEPVSQAAAFYRSVATHQRLWTLRDAGGFPAPVTASGSRAQPFWSRRALAEWFIQTVPAYRAFTLVEVTYADFRDRWVPGLVASSVLVGIDWTGPGLTGDDYECAWVCECVDIEIARLARTGGTARKQRPDQPAADGQAWLRRIFRSA